MGYKKRVADAKEARNFRLPEGIYKTRFIGWEFKKSNQGNEMFILNFKILDVPTDAPEGTLVKIKEKKRDISISKVTSLDFHFDELLEFIEANGANLDSFDENDLTFQDIKDTLKELEDILPKFDINLTHKENSTYNNYYIRDLKDVEKVLEPKESIVVSDSDSTPSAPDVPTAPVGEQTPVAPKAPEAPTPPPAPKAPEPVITREQLLAGGWTNEQIDEHYGETLA